MNRAGRQEVLITRPAAEADATARHIRQRGFVPVLAPLLEVERRPVRWPPQTAALVLTSGNAIVAMEQGRDVPVFTVGDATAARAHQAGFTDVTSARGTGTELVA